MHTADNHDNSDQDKVNGFNPQESQSHGSCDIKIEEGISFAWSDLNVSTEPVSESKCLGLTCKERVHWFINKSKIVWNGWYFSVQSKNTVRQNEMKPHKFLYSNFKGGWVFSRNTIN